MRAAFTILGLLLCVVPIRAQCTFQLYGVGGPCSPSGPTLVHEESFPNSYTAGGITSIVYHYAGAQNTGTLTNNCFIVKTTMSVASGTLTSITVADNTANSYSYALTQPGFNDTRTRTQVAYVLSAAGAQNITVTYNGTSPVANNVTTEISEYARSTCVLDVAAVTGSGTAATTISTSALVTSTNGDLIEQFAVQDSLWYITGNPGITPGSGFTLISANDFAGTASQYRVQTTAGSITPSMTLAPAGSYGTVAVAFKPGSGGTPPPTSMYIVKLQHIDMWQATNFPSLNTVHVQAPTQGNLLVGMWEGFVDDFPNSISDGNGNTYFVGGASVGNSTGGIVSYFYSEGIVPSPTLSLTLTLPTISNTADSQFREVFLYDIANAPVPAFDRWGDGLGNTASNPFNGITITPQYNPSGLILVLDSHASGTSQTVSPGFDITTNPTPSITTSPLDNNNGAGQYFTSSVSPVTFAWTGDQGPGFFTDLAVVLRGPNAVGPPAGTGSWTPRLSWTGNHTSNPPSFTYGSNVTAGDLLTCMVSTDGGTDITVSDNQNGAWQQLMQTADGSFNHRVAFFYFLGTVGGVAPVVTSSVASTGSIYCGSYNKNGGVTTGWPIDGSVGAMSVTSTSATVQTDNGSVTTNFNGDLVFCIVSNNGGGTFTAGTGFVMHASDTTEFDFEEDQVQGTAGAVAGLFNGGNGTIAWIGGCGAIRHQ